MRKGVRQGEINTSKWRIIWPLIFKLTFLSVSKRVWCLLSHGYMQHLSNNFKGHKDMIPADIPVEHARLLATKDVFMATSELELFSTEAKFTITMVLGICFKQISPGFLLQLHLMTFQKKLNSFCNFWSQINSRHTLSRFLNTWRKATLAVPDNKCSPWKP